MRRTGFSLWELIAVVTILGILAGLIVPRILGHHTNAMRASCLVNQGDIEMQVKLWRRNNGSYPAANLADIGANTAYFPEGPPTCPVDGTSYTIDTTSGFVVGHTH
jgi:prepilin-type N-terminal cleavage/methylation domain-containing protein